MENPEVVLVRTQSLTVEGTPYRCDEFEIRGGLVAGRWANVLQPLEVPVCQVTIWTIDRSVLPRGCHGGIWVGAFVGSVWPMAWPQLFEASDGSGAAGTRPTPLAEALFEAARARGLKKEAP